MKVISAALLTAALTTGVAGASERAGAPCTPFQPEFWSEHCPADGVGPLPLPQMSLGEGFDLFQENWFDEAWNDLDLLDTDRTPLPLWRPELDLDAQQQARPDDGLEGRT